MKLKENLLGTAAKFDKGDYGREQMAASYFLDAIEQCLVENNSKEVNKVVILDTLKNCREFFLDITDRGITFSTSTVGLVPGVKMAISIQLPVSRPMRAMFQRRAELLHKTAMTPVVSGLYSSVMSRLVSNDLEYTPSFQIKDGALIPNRGGQIFLITSFDLDEAFKEIDQWPGTPS